MKRLLAATLLALSLSAAPAARAADESGDLPVPADKSAIVMNFENVDLTAFIKFISRISGRNIVFGDKIEGTVSVVSPTPVNVEQAFVMFQSVLATQGLTTVDEGAVLRIVPTKDARTAGASVTAGERTPAGFTTKLIPLSYVNAGDIARVLAPQVSKDGAIIPYEGTNTVIVSETSSNLARISDMIHAMDIPGHEQVIAVIPLKHAEAMRTAEQIQELLLGQGSGRRRGGGGGGGDRGSSNDDKDKNQTTSPLQLGFKISPDERTNSLVVMAPAVEMARVKELVRGIDVEIRPGEERVHVYYAKNADAESLVEVVSGMILGSKNRSRRDRQGSNKKEETSSMSSSPASSSLSNSSTPPSVSDDSVSITADPATNAVIVDGPQQEWKTILSLLVKLDIPRPQVFIEAIIVEASANKAKALGFDYQAAIDVGAGDILMRSNIAQLGSAFINPLALGGMVAAAASDKQVTLADGTTLPANYALLQAINATSDIEVLSAPTLLTLDNQEAEIIVGQNIPFVTGRATELNNIDNVFTQVERKDVGIKLRVRPQVAEGDVIVLDVQQEVSAVVRTNLTEETLVTVGPTTTIRSASTSVSVGDGRTVVIGGLISNRTEDADQKVPLLGDIPWLGRLFTYKRSDKEKVNLIIFLTPHVIRTPRDLDFVSADRRNEFRGQMRDTTSKLPGDPGSDMEGGAWDDEAPQAAPPAPKPAPVAKVAPQAKAKAPAPSSQDQADAEAARAAMLKESAAAAAATRNGSTYRHAASEKAARTYPLNQDVRGHAPF